MTLDLSEIRRRGADLRNACKDNIVPAERLALMALACAGDVQPLVTALVAAERLAEYRQQRINAALKLLSTAGDPQPGRDGVLRRNLVTVLESSVDPAAVPA